MHQDVLDTNLLKSSSAGNDLEVLVDTKLKTSQQCALAAKKANSSGSCIRKSISSRSREVSLCLYLSEKPCLKWCLVLDSPVQEM